MCRRHQSKKLLINPESCHNGLAASDVDSDSSSDESEVSAASNTPCSRLFTTITVKRPAKASPEVNSEKGKREKKKKSNGSSSTAVRSSSRHGQSKNN